MITKIRNTKDKTLRGFKQEDLKFASGGPSVPGGHDPRGSEEEKTGEKLITVGEAN